jgi:hypothetical protein
MLQPGLPELRVAELKDLTATVARFAFWEHRPADMAPIPDRFVENPYRAAGVPGLVQHRA